MLSQKYNSLTSENVLIWKVILINWNTKTKWSWHSEPISLKWSNLFLKRNKQRKLWHIYLHSSAWCRDLFCLTLYCLTYNRTVLALLQEWKISVLHSPTEYSWLHTPLGFDVGETGLWPFSECLFTFTCLHPESESLNPLDASLHT